jgi:hypothetical protein
MKLSTSQESRRYDYRANPAGDAQLHHPQGHDPAREIIECIVVVRIPGIVMVDFRPPTGNAPRR